MSMKPSLAAVGVKIVKRDQSTTPAPKTCLEEYLVATYPPTFSIQTLEYATDLDMPQPAASQLSAVLTYGLKSKHRD